MAAPDRSPGGGDSAFESFRSLVRAEGRRLYRDLPWRRTRDPYIVWLSEVMLQQTQVRRVEDRMPAWLDAFPTLEALAAAPVARVLEAWQGMGYNRRALALHATARRVVEDHAGTFPSDTKALVALPGIGPATAQGIRAFAFDLPGVYLETNVRTVFLHHFFPDVPAVPDRELVPLVECACPMAPDGSPSGSEGDARACGPFAAPLDADDTPRNWYYALLDYGAHLKKTVPNPSRRSAGYARQSRFEGSRRQKRAEIVRLLLDAGSRGATTTELLDALRAVERRAGRDRPSEETLRGILRDLAKEGFSERVDAPEGDGERWRIAAR